MKSTESDVCHFEVDAVFISGAIGAAGGECVDCRNEENR